MNESRSGRCVMQKNKTKTRRDDVAPFLRGQQTPGVGGLFFLFCFSFFVFFDLRVSGAGRRVFIALMMFSDFFFYDFHSFLFMADPPRFFFCFFFFVLHGAVAL